MPVSEICRVFGGLSAMETLSTLTKIAGDLANAPDGVLGAESKAWTNELLTTRRDSLDPLERAVSRAVARLPSDKAIAHAQAVFTLQVLALAAGTTEGRRPSDGQLAFWMLAINDHIPEWMDEQPGALSQTEDVLASLMSTSVFNQSDDPIRLLVRNVEIMGGTPACGPINSADWGRVQARAFGCAFDEYAEIFLVPMYLLARQWSVKNPPVVFREPWIRGEPRTADLYRRWFSEAALPVERAAAVFAADRLPCGLFGLPAAFFRTPFIDTGDKLLGLSPWHVRDHAVLGTWAKLNAACKDVLQTTSIQQFSSTFGYLFELWCARLAREARDEGEMPDRLLVPEHPGADDEIEDVVFLDGDRVALLSAKASLIPEANLKTARSPGDVIKWLRRFFFEDVKSAKDKGHRGGAVLLLNRKIDEIRAGKYEARGISRDAIVLPGIVCFDHISDCGGILYKWLGQECARLGVLSGRAGVRPLTIVHADEYEALLSLGGSGLGVCNLLAEKSSDTRSWGPLDQFLYDKAADKPELRRSSTVARCDNMVSRCLERLRKAGVTRSDGV